MGLKACLDLTMIAMNLTASSESWFKITYLAMFEEATLEMASAAWISGTEVQTMVNDSFEKAAQKLRRMLLP